MKLLTVHLASLIPVISLNAGAQYAIPEFTIAGGGGRSEGGRFSIAGTIAQPDAAPPLTGGQFAVAGGFWSNISAIQMPGAPRLAIQLAGTSVQVSWPAPASGLLLEQSTTIPGNWQPVSLPYSTNGSAVSVTVPISGQLQLFRLH